VDLEDILRRSAIVARLWNAYPSAGRCTEGQLLEYVNATRALEIAELERCIDLAIARGGEFIPSAGDVMRRAAEQIEGGPPAGEDKDAWFRFRAAVRDRLSHIAARTADVPPLRGLPAPGQVEAVKALRSGLEGAS
jgi:hypothetical protein